MEDLGSFKKPDLSAFNKNDPEKRLNEILSSFGQDEVLASKIRSLKMSKAEVKKCIPLLIDYKDNHAECLATDSLPEGGPDFEMDIVREEEGIVAKWKPRKRDAEKSEVSAGYLKYSFPEPWLLSTFEDVKWTEKRKKSAFWMINEEAYSSDKWHYIIGESGTGKSFIVACFCNKFAKGKKEAVAFLNTAEELDYLRNAAIRDKDAFAKRMEAYKNVPLLVLDGFGNEYKSDFALSTVLYPLLSYRSTHDLPVFFASDFTLEEIEAMYSKKIDSIRAGQLVGLIRKKAGNKPTNLDPSLA